MKTKLIKENSNVLISFIVGMSLMLLANSVMATPYDPSEGMCDGLDPSSGLYSTCIQAHSATNRIEHLNSVGASPIAINKAQAALDGALAQYTEIAGEGETVPGLCDFSGVWGYKEVEEQTVELTSNAGIIDGTWVDSGYQSDRPPFSGRLSDHGCTVEMTFPDHGDFRGIHDGACRIQWSHIDDLDSEDPNNYWIKYGCEE